MTKQKIIIIGTGRMTEALMLAELARLEHPEINFFALSEEDVLRMEAEKPSDWLPPAGFDALARQYERKAQITPRPQHPDTPPDPAEPQYMRNFKAGKAGRRKGKRTDIPSPRNRRRR